MGKGEGGRGKREWGKGEWAILLLPHLPYLPYLPYLPLLPHPQSLIIRNVELSPRQIQSI